MFLNSFSEMGFKKTIAIFCALFLGLWELLAEGTAILFEPQSPASKLGVITVVKIMYSAWNTQNVQPEFWAAFLRNQGSVFHGAVSDSLLLLLFFFSCADEKICLQIQKTQF